MSALLADIKNVIVTWPAAARWLAASAFRNVDDTVVAPFRYSPLIWSALAGYFVLGEVSDRVSIAGAVLIVGSIFTSRTGNGSTTARSPPAYRCANHLISHAKRSRRPPAMIVAGLSELGYGDAGWRP